MMTVEKRIWVKKEQFAFLVWNKYEEYSIDINDDDDDDDDAVLRHTFPIFTGLGRCPIVSWDFAVAVSKWYWYWYV